MSCKPGQLADFGVDQRRKAEQLVEIAGLQGVLVEALARSGADIEVLDRVEEHVQSRDRTDLAAQLLDHLADRRSLVRAA